MTSNAENPYKVTDPALDLAARSFWAQTFEEREKAFARLRAENPVSYHRACESTLLPPTEETPGFWSVVRAEDCWHVSRNPDLFCSDKGVLMEDMPYVVLAATASFLVMDGEDHRKMRGLVHSVFTPRNIKKMEGWVRDYVRGRMDEIIHLGEGDFADLFCKYVPGRVFARLFGLEDDVEGQHTIMEAAERMLAWDDPRMALGRDAITTFAEEAERIQDIALREAEKRRDNPGEDLVSWVANAEFEGQKLDEWEIASFFSLLGSAANDTTRHSLAHGVRLFSENPEQKKLLLEDFEGRIGGAVEEILRHSSPVMHFRRTATQDTEISGVPIRKGEHVVMWYCSGNRDDSVFPDAGTFDILRSPNDHLAFGAGGPHFCLGNTLGRFMLRAALEEIYTRIPDIEITEQPHYQINNFIHGVHAMPVRWTPPQN